MQPAANPSKIQLEQHVFFGALGTTHKVLSESIAGSAAIVEHTLEPKSLGAPMHKHTYEDEVSYVLEGELSVMQDGKVQVATAGQYIVKPRGIFHTFWNSGETTLRFIEIITPGHFEGYFAEMEVLLPPNQPPAMDKIGETAARYGLLIDPFAADAIIKEYGLTPLG